ncbi:unnamed protein product [marine sediment metagenome]|uniref:Uncharacterized protein n=1 Tax=marine sediment metagenome TaxID=412755 RepID=X1G9D4_9ZZZZ
MAVTTVGQDIYNGALAKSSKNEPGNFSVAEIILRINNRLNGLYEVAARVNAIFFAETATEAETAGVWSRPEEALSVIKIQDATVADVVILPHDDQQAEPSKLSVYEFGQEFFAITNLTGTPSGNLTFWYARRPTAVANLSPATLDAQWREDFNELLILELAIELSAKDGRTAEVGTLKEDRNGWLARYVSFLQHSTSGERRRFGHRKIININDLLPLLAGGAG